METGLFVSILKILYLHIFHKKINFSQRFGAHRVDFTDSNRSRTPKDSVAMLREIFTDNGFLSVAAGRKKYHDIIDRYADNDVDSTTTSTSVTIPTTTTTTTRTATNTPADNGSQLTVGSLPFNMLAVCLIMLHKYVAALS